MTVGPRITPIHKTESGSPVCTAGCSLHDLKISVEAAVTSATTAINTIIRAQGSGLWIRSVTLASYRDATTNRGCPGYLLFVDRNDIPLKNNLMGVFSLLSMMAHTAPVIADLIRNLAPEVASEIPGQAQNDDSEIVALNEARFRRGDP
jgi:hypothetical protein